jgi:hypothetical protein
MTQVAEPEVIRVITPADSIENSEEVVSTFTSSEDPKLLEQGFRLFIRYSGPFDPFRDISVVRTVPLET